MNRDVRNRSRAFTLLEIMVALTLFSIILIAIYSTWNSIFKGRRVAEKAAAESQRMRVTMRTLKDSLLCTVMFNANANFYWFSGETEGDFSSLSFVARLPESFPRSGCFGDQGVVRRLTYTVEPSQDSGKQLVLRQNPILRDPPDKDDTEFPLVLAHDLKQFLVEFIDPQSGDWVPEWTYTNQLPREVRVTVVVGKGDKYSNNENEALVETVAMPALAVPLMMQLPFGPNGMPPGAAPPGGQNNGQNLNNGQNPNGINPNQQVPQNGFRPQ